MSVCLYFHSFTNPRKPNFSFLYQNSNLSSNKPLKLKVKEEFDCYEEVKEWKYRRLSSDYVLWWCIQFLFNGDFFRERLRRGKQTVCDKIIIKPAGIWRWTREFGEEWRRTKRMSRPALRCKRLLLKDSLPAAPRQPTQLLFHSLSSTDRDEIPEESSYYSKEGIPCSKQIWLDALLRVFWLLKVICFKWRIY